MPQFQPQFHRWSSYYRYSERPGAVPQEIFKAAKVGDDAALRTYLETTTLAMMDKQGRESLVRDGWLYGHIGVVQAMIDHGYDLNDVLHEQDGVMVSDALSGIVNQLSYGYSVKKPLEMARFLVKNGARFPSTALRALASSPSADIDFLRVMVHEFGLTVNAGVVYWTACRNSRVDVIEFVLSHGGSSFVNTKRGLSDASSPGFRRENRKYVKVADSRSDTPLHCAVIAGHFDVARVLIKAGADIHAENNDGERPIHVARDIRSTMMLLGLFDERPPGIAGALLSNDNEVLAALLQHGEDPDTVRINGKFGAVMAACAMGNLEAVKLLLAHGATIDFEKYEELVLLIDMDRPDIASELLDTFPTQIIVDRAVGEEEYFLLNAASSKGRCEILKLFLVKGVMVLEPRSQYDSGYYPLYEAAEKNATECFQLLLDHGFTNLWGDSNAPPISDLAYKQPDILRLMIRHCIARPKQMESYRTIDVLNWVHITGDLELGRALFTNKVLTSNHFSWDAEKPMDWAIASGFDDIVSLLNEFPEVGANRPCVVCHVINGDYEGTRQALEEGRGDPNENSYRDDSALHAAIVKHKQDQQLQLKFVQLLLAHGAKPGRRIRQTSFDGEPLLVLAVRSGCSLDLIRLLLDHGADVMATGKKTLNTPLHIAAEQKDLALVKLLVEFGAPVNARNSKGQRTQDVPSYLTIRYFLAQQAELQLMVLDAVEQRDLTKVQRCIDNKVDLDATWTAFTPLDMAILNGNHAIVDLLLLHGAKIGPRLALQAATTDKYDAFAKAAELGADLQRHDVFRACVDREDLRFLQVILDKGRIDQRVEPWEMRVLLDSPRHAALALHHRNAPAASMVQETLSECRNRESIKLLVSLGYDLNTPNANHERRRNLILRHQFYPRSPVDRDFVKFLVEAGADPSLVIGKVSSREHVTILASFGADINKRDTNNETPFVKALKRHARELIPDNDDYEYRLGDLRDCIGFMISALKPDLSVQDSMYGYSPLHHAVIINDLDLVDRLIRLGADPHLNNKLGKPPIHFTRRFGDGPFIRRLLLAIHQGSNVSG